jgi:signal transduction histidine kinase
VTSVRTPEGDAPVDSAAGGVLFLRELGAGDNDLTVEYAGLSFLNEESVRFRTRLEPPDTGFSPPRAERSTQFRNLGEGEYRFSVVSVNGRGEESSPTAVRFVILPPFWKTWWFTAAALLLLAAAAGASARAVTIRRVERAMREMERQRDLQRERERISRDLHDQVGGELAGLISGLDLVDRIGDAGHITGIRYGVETVGDAGVELYPQEVLGLFRVAQEALANILKHARPTRVTVILTSERGIGLTVENDGAPPAGAGPGPLGGRGLGNMEKRMRDLGGTFEWGRTEAGNFIVRAACRRSGTAKYPT